MSKLKGYKNNAVPAETYQASEFMQKIKRDRKFYGIKIRAMSKMCGMSLESYSKCENGTLKPTVIQKYAMKEIIEIERQKVFDGNTEVQI